MSTRHELYAAQTNEKMHHEPIFLLREFQIINI